MIFKFHRFLFLIFTLKDMLARFRNPQTTKQEQRYPEVDSFQTYKKPVLRNLGKYNL